MAIQDTIFSPSFGNRPTYLVGRDAVIQDFLDGLKTRPGSKERAVMMLGQRGCGKTVLLWELADRARNAGFVVASPTIASEDMLERIIEKIQDDGERYINERKTHISGGNIGVLGFTAGLQVSRDAHETKSFSYKLTQLCKRITKQGSGVLILVDELQANTPEIRQLVIAYQELVGEQQNIALVMAGLPGAVSATLNDKVLTFLNRAKKTELEALRTSEVDAFFQKSFEQLGIQISDQLRRKAAEASAGSPYLLQLIGHSVVMYATDEGYVGEKELEPALTSAKHDFKNDVCKTTLAALSEKDIAFAQAISKDGQTSKMSTIAKRMGVTPDYAQKYRKRLIDAGIIEASGHGMVSFAVPYLADYLHEEE